MRKFTLMLTFLAFTAATFAQTADCGLSVGGKVEKAVATQQPKEFGKVIWSEDFNGTKWASTVVADELGYLLDPDATLPEGWVITDGNELNYFWHWSDVGPRGRYTSPNASAAGGAASFVPNPSVVAGLPAGTSTSNGFMMLESDYFNTASTGLISSDPLDMDASIEFGPIDMSDAPGAIFSLKTIYRTCCSATKLLGLAIGVPDGAGGITWSDEIRLNILTPNNAYTYSSERSVDVNISRVKAGSSFIVTAGADEVYFKLHKTGASHYSWLVDDISIYEPPTNDLIVEDTWFDYMYDATDPDYGQSDTEKNNFWGGYTQIPQSVVAPFVQFRTAVNNNGTTDATNAKMNVKIDKDGAQVYNELSTPKTVAKFLRDTLVIAADFTPADKGFYQVSMTVAMDAPDDAAGNNGSGYDFYVVNDTYSRVRMGAEADFVPQGPADWASGAYDGDAIAQPYDFPESVDEVSLKALKVYFSAAATADDEASIIAGDFAMYARVYKIDEEGNIIDAGIASELYTIQIQDTNTWITLDFVDDGNLVVPGGQTYYVGIETYTGFTPTATKRRNFEVGADNLGPKQPLGGGLVYLSKLANWYSTGHNYAIDLIINTPSVNVTFNVDMTQPIADPSFFVPGTDLVYVTGSFNGWDQPGTGESILMTDDNGDKIYTATVELDANIGEIKYKYFKNATWDFGDNAGGDRPLTIADADITTNDVWVHVNGVNDMNMDAITLAPNPFKSELVINNAEGASQIVISNVLGQAVMTVTEITNRVVLSTSELHKGVYFVTIIDNNNNRRTERVVKH